MVIGASVDPIAMSGSDTGLATAAAIALCARATPGTAVDAKTRRAAKAMRLRTFSGYSETDWQKASRRAPAYRPFYRFRRPKAIWLRSQLTVK